MTELRREDDRRIDDLNKKVDDVAGKVSEIRDMLISEPEASPLGRALMKRADTNAKNIADHDTRLDAIERWMTRWQGSWMLVTGIAVVLGIIGTFFAVVKPLIEALQA